MQSFIFGLMAGISFFYLLKIPIQRSLFIYICIYFAALQLLNNQNTDQYIFTSNSALAYSIPFIAWVINKIPYIENPKEHFKIFSISILLYSASIFGLYVFIQLFPIVTPYKLLASILIITLIISLLSLKINYLFDFGPKTKALLAAFFTCIISSVLTNIYSFLNGFNGTETYEILGLSLLFIGQLIAIKLLPNHNEIFSSKKQLLLHDTLKEWLSTSRKIKDFNHDLRQPLSTISVISGVGKAMSDRDDMRDRFQHILTAHTSFNSMLNQFLRDLKIDMRKLIVDSYVQQEGLVRCDLSDHFSRLYDEYQYFARAKGLSLRVKPTNLEVYSDPKALDKILRNGLDNAIKYTSSGGIYMGVRREWQSKHGGPVRIQILDTGTGIDNNKTPEQHKGWGYGSTIVKNLSQVANAKVIIGNRKGTASGTCFDMLLGNNKNYKPSTHTLNKPNQKNPPIIIVNTKQTSIKVSQTPDEIEFDTIIYSNFSQIKEAENRHQQVFFYLSVAQSLEEIENLQKMASTYHAKTKNKMTLIVATKETLISGINQDDFALLVFSNMYIKGQTLTIDVINNLLINEDNDLKFTLET